MRVLLDEHLPHDLAREFTGHESSTVHAQGWDGLKNGVLLAEAAKAGFEVLVTNDKSFEFQQNLKSVGLGNRRARCSFQQFLMASSAPGVQRGEVSHVAE